MKEGGKIAEQKLFVIIKAISLMEYTMTVTSNRKRYPNKYITLVRKIQEISMSIYEALVDANQLKLDVSKNERLCLQTRAITNCDKLSCYLELSMKLRLIGSDTVEYWQGLITDVKRLAISWRSKDTLR